MNPPLKLFQVVLETFPHRGEAEVNEVPQHCFEYCNTLGWFWDKFDHPQRLKLLYLAAAYLNQNAWHQKLTGELSTGTRRIVDLACILAQEPKILLLDEPSGGVAQKETEALGPLLLRIREHTGCSLLVIEHDMPMISSICDRLVALELGSVIAQGAPQEVLSHPAVIASYLGTDEKAIQRSGTSGSSRSRSRSRAGSRS